MSVFLSPVGGAGAQFFDNNGNPLSGGKLYTYAAGTTTPQATYTSAAGSTFHTNPIVLDAAGRVPNGGEIWLADNQIYKFVLKTSEDVLLATWDNITGVNSNFVNYTTETEVQTATAGQTVFTLTTMSYVPGTGSLTVYVDGVNQYEGDSYLETNSTTVTFTAGLHVGALVKFTTAVQTTGNATDASVVTYTAPYTGAVQYTVEDKLSQTISVADFGASSSATAAANLAAFKLAVDAVPEGGSLLIPSAASFYSIDTSGGLSAAIVIDKRMQVVFEGDVKATFSAIQTNPPYIFKVTADNVTFTGGGGKIVGDGTTDSTNSGTDQTIPGLVYVSGDNFTMVDCIIDTPPKTGVMLYECQGAKITGNTFTGGPVSYGSTGYFAIRTYLGSSHNISSNLFTPDSDGGMYVNTIFMNQTNSCVIDSNICIHPYEKLVYCVGDKNTVSNNQVIGNPNTIPGSSPAKKGTLTSVYRFDGDYNLCIGNYSDFCGAGATCYNSKGNLISGNTFLRNGQLGIVAFEAPGYVGSISGTTITNNSMSFDGSMGFTIGIGAIQVTASESAATDILITGNFIDTFVNVDGAGINVQGTTSTKITKAKISNNHIISSDNGVLIKYVEESVVSENLMNDITNTMVVQLNTCSANSITNNFSTTAGSTLDSGYSTDSTYAGNQCTKAPLQGSFTMPAANNYTVTHGGTRLNAQVFLQPKNASAAALMGSAKALYVTISQPNFNVITANGAAAAGTEEFWYNIVQ